MTLTGLPHSERETPPKRQLILRFEIRLGLHIKAHFFNNATWKKKINKGTDYTSEGCTYHALNTEYAIFY